VTSTVLFLENSTTNSRLRGLQRAPTGLASRCSLAPLAMASCAEAQTASCRSASAWRLAAAAWDDSVRIREAVRSLEDDTATLGCLSRAGLYANTGGLPGAQAGASHARAGRLKLRMRCGQALSRSAGEPRTQWLLWQALPDHFAQLICKPSCQETLADTYTRLFLQDCGC
jgi:hypothetical protein